MPAHVAVIMDGNGRWATRQGLPRLAGHHAGVEAARRTVRAAAQRGIAHLTLFGFSADNWRRPGSEVRVLMTLFQRYFRLERRNLRENNIQMTVIGRRDRLPGVLLEEIRRTEAATAGLPGMHLRLALDYSSREAMSERALMPAPAGEGVPDVDLLIRSGGEKRLSDFLLWESAYAELWFTDIMWPDFQPQDLDCAIDEFSARQRRFGALPEVSVAAPPGMQAPPLRRRAARLNAGA